MWHRVDYVAWNPFTKSGEADFVAVDADGGDDAAAKGALAIAARLNGQRNVKIISVAPCDAPAADPEPAAPAADPGDGDDADDAGEPTRAELLAEAERRGIAVDRRWGVERLLAALSSADGGQG